MGKSKVLIIPDVFYEGFSGAIAARSAGRIFNLMGWEVAVFTTEEEKPVSYPVKKYQKTAFNFKSNYLGSEAFGKELHQVLQDYKPDYVFSIGGVVNIPLNYYDIIREHNIPHGFLILCQDFYCARIHAALPTGPCTLCLDKSPLNAFIHNCGIKTARRKELFLLNGMLVRKRLKKRLARVTHVFGSTQEQLGFYERYGIPLKRLIKLPLFFDHNRIAGPVKLKGDYYVMAAQNRVEKGIHLIKDILPYFKGEKLKLVFASKEEADKAISEHKMQELVDHQGIEIIHGKSWTGGLDELYAGSKGVLISSIWPTTTEFAFLEALGMGKPVISFDLGIHHEVIKNGENGYRIPLDNFSRLTEVLAELNDAKIYEQVSQGALNLYQEMTSDENFKSILETTINTK